MVLDELDNAISSLKLARRQAGAGTAMRIDSLITETKRLKTDTEAIRDDEG